jgi:hypothetical protein
MASVSQADMSGVFRVLHVHARTVPCMDISGKRRPLVAAVGLLLVPFGCSPAPPAAEPEPTTATSEAQPAGSDPAAPPGSDAAQSPESDAEGRRPQLPLGGRTLFPRYRLVAYYGTAGTGSLGVLGEAPPTQTTKRLRAVAKRYRDAEHQVQIAYELISTVADASAGTDGDYSHFIDRSSVRTYVRAARRHKAYLVLDLQPGRSTFLSQARQLRWALKKPWVGLALDPEWRMGPGPRPADRERAGRRGQPGIGVAVAAHPGSRPAAEGADAAPVPHRHGPEP